MQDQRPDFLATHPSTPRAGRLSPSGGARSSAPPASATPDRDRYLDGIDGMVFGDDPSQGFVRDRTFVHPGLGIGFTVPEGFVIDNTSEAVLATGIDGTALRFDAVGLAARHRSCRLPQVGLGQRPRRGERAELLGQRPAGGVGHGRGQGLALPIAVIQTGGDATYRFIFANEAVTPAFIKAATETVDGFRMLSASELASLPSRCTSTCHGRAPAIPRRSLARRMHGVDRPRDSLPRAQRSRRRRAARRRARKLKIVDDL